MSSTGSYPPWMKELMADVIGREMATSALDRDLEGVYCSWAFLDKEGKDAIYHEYMDLSFAAEPLSDNAPPPGSETSRMWCLLGELLESQGKAPACQGCDETLTQQPPGAKIRKCSGCNVAVYCGRDCQKRDWRRHKKECRPNCCSPRELLPGACVYPERFLAFLRLENTKRVKPHRDSMPLDCK
eukprot:gene30813-35844_t